MAKTITQAQLDAINTFNQSQYKMSDLPSEDASKALSPDAGAGTIGYNVDPNNMNGFTTPLRVEALDDQVKTLTFGAEQFVFFNQISKRAARSSVEQYITYDRHGEIGHSMASAEGAISKITAQSYGRHTINMKYLTTARQVTVQAGMANSITDPLQAATQDAVVSLASEIEWMSFYGDKDLHDANNTEGLEFDGLNKLIPDTNVIDLRGKVLAEADLNDAAIMISKAYGYPTDAFLPMGAKSRLISSLLDRQRVFQSSGAQNLTLGFNAPQFQSIAGMINLNGSNLMENYNILDENDPFVAGIKPTATAKVESESKAGKFDDVATLEYRVVAVAQDTHSEAVATEPVVLTAKTDTVQLEVTVPTNFESPIEFIRVYRKSEAGLFYEISKVSAHEAKNGKVTIVDDNSTIPGTVDAYVGQMTPDVIALYEWLPITRFALATMTAAYTWSFLWFGALALFAPRKWVRIKNIATVEVAPQR